MALTDADMDRRFALTIGGGALAVAAAIAFAYSGDDDGGPVREERPKPIAAVQAVQHLDRPTAAVTPPGLDPARPTDCLIEPSQVVKVNSGVEGVIAAIYVDRGDVVHRGQVVAQLRADVDQASLAAAQAKAGNVYTERAAASRAVYLDAVRKRSEQIGQYLARDNVEEAQANARAAAEERNAAQQERRVAQLESVQHSRILGEKTVRSPVNGIVTERAMSPGEYRGSDASHILTVAQVDPLNVEVFAPIAQLGSVSIGQSVKIFPEQPVGGEYVARIKVIDRVFDAASGTFGMRLELPNPGNRLPAGLRCRIEIGTAHKGG
ncbi:MAG: efflux RND transporter periplasmic adaptor subunit [Novosphingobium sp.]